MVEIDGSIFKYFDNLVDIKYYSFDSLKVFSGGFVNY